MMFLCNLSMPYCQSVPGPCEEIEEVVQRHAADDNDDQTYIDCLNPIQYASACTVGNHNVNRSLGKILIGAWMAPATSFRQVGWIDRGSGVG